ncbi:MAG: TonB-dependent receptor plug domain-containing protein [Pseudomonadota bacterium]
MKLLRLHHQTYAASLMLSTCLVAPAQAQLLDYSGFETLFGEPVTMTATGQPVRESDSPVNLDIITAEEIARSGARTIPEVLDRLPGVQMMQTGSMDQQVSIRGYATGSQNRILVLVNNKQVYADSYGYTPWRALPVQLAEIKQIEVVRGPNTALFGFNAAAGVINIVTINPIDDQQISSLVEVGTDGTRKVSGVVSQAITENLGARISFGFERVNAYNDPRAIDGVQNPVPLDEETSGSVSAEVRYNPTDRITMSFDASYAESEHYQTEPTGLHLAWDHDIFSARASVMADTDFGLISAQISHTHTDLQYPAVDDLQTGLDTTIADLSNTIKVTERDTVRLAAQYRRVVGDILTIENNDTPLIPGDDPFGEVGYDGFALSGMWHRDWTEQFSTTVAGRFDYLRLFANGEFGPKVPYTPDDIDNGITNFGFTAAGIYRPTEYDTLRLTVSRGAQLPSLFVLGGIQLSDLLVDAGYPEAQATQVTNFEIGYERRIDQLHSSLTLAGFYQQNEDVQNVAAFDTTTGDVGNYDDLDFVGFEASLEGDHNGFSWGASYSYLLPLNNVEFFNTVRGFPGNRVPYDPSQYAPKHEVEARVGYTNGPFTVDLFARYRTHFEALARRGGVVTVNVPGLGPIDIVEDVYFDETIDDQLSIDLQAAYALTDNLSVNALVQQVNDAEMQTGAFQVTERRAYLSMTATF